MSGTNHYEDGIGVGRNESPAIEHAVQDEFARTLKELLETKGMYQNLRINEAIFDTLPSEFREEFRQRPIMPYSRGDGDDNPRDRGFGASQPLGTPVNKMEAGFYLPNVNIHCSHCEHSTTFLSMMYSTNRSFDNPYPLFGSDTEQVFTLYYRCGSCRGVYIAFQVLRKGFKLQLTGRSAPYRPAIAKEWPKSIADIVQDAFVAGSENDIPAAYYHLRTAAEFYLKGELGIPVQEKLEGAELCEQYNATIDTRLKSGFPSFGTMYSELSAGLHTRQVSLEQFQKLCNDFLAHLQAKALFAQYSGK